MKMTPKRAKAIVQRYNELLEKAERFLRETDRDEETISEERRQKQNHEYHSMPSVSLDYDGNVLHKVNVACHCHPEMRTFKLPSEKFLKWLEADNKKWENY